MTLPSQLLRSMACNIAEALGDAVAAVKVHSGPVRAEAAKDTLTFKSPATVLVTCLGYDLRGDGYGVADAVWAAIVLVNGKGKDDDGAIDANITAANIAAQVAALVENQRWDGLAFTASDRIHVTNEHSEKIASGSNWGVWAVAWRQSFEITRADQAEVSRLASIHYTFVMGDDATPDAYATIEFPEPTV